MKMKIGDRVKIDKLKVGFSWYSDEIYSSVK